MILCTFQLSLRENPLVVRFVQEISLHPPSLLELSARVIRTSSISFEPHEIPRTLRDYLNTAHHCVNPKCKGKLLNFQFMCMRVSLSILNHRSTFVIGDNEERKNNIGLFDLYRFRCIL